MSTFRYEVDNNLVVNIYEDTESAQAESPFLVQDIKPTGEPWFNREEAENWAESHIANLITWREEYAAQKAALEAQQSEEQPQE